MPISDKVNPQRWHWLQLNEASHALISPDDKCYGGYRRETKTGVTLYVVLVHRTTLIPQPKTGAPVYEGLFETEIDAVETVERMALSLG